MRRKVHAGKHFQDPTNPQVPDLDMLEREALGGATATGCEAEALPVFGFGGLW